MNQIGLVEMIKDNIATIFVRRTSMCGDNCHTCSSTCNIDGIKIEVETTMNLEVGDYVVIESETKNILMYTLIAYGIPLAVMIITLFIILEIFKNFTYKEITAGLGSIASLLLSYFILSKIDDKFSKTKRVNYYISKKL